MASLVRCWLSISIRQIGCRISPSNSLFAKVTATLRAAMTAATETDVATSTDAWPIAVHNISKNLVSAQYAGA